MRPIKLFLIATLALVGLAGGGAALVAVGYSQGYQPEAYADPAVPDAGPMAPAVAAIDAAAPEVGAVATAPVGVPCIDRDGPGPAPCIAQPLDEPLAYVDTAASARKVGWSLLVLVIAFPLLIGLGRWVPWLREGYRALLLSGATSAVAAAANAGFLGGSWYAMLTAAGGALMLAWQGDRTAAQLKGYARAVS